MSLITVSGLILGGWVMLSVMLSERQWRLDYIRYEIATRPPILPEEEDTGDVIPLNSAKADAKKPDAAKGGKPTPADKNPAPTKTASKAT